MSETELNLKQPGESAGPAPKKPRRTSKSGGKKRARPKVKTLKVMMVVDLPHAPPENGDYLQYLDTEDWVTEKDLYRALRRLGHEVTIFGIYDSVLPLIEVFTKERPDVVFNMCEAFKDDRAQEPNVVALWELLGLKYTGAGPNALRVCQDKALSKKILSHHGISVPPFRVSTVDRPLKKLEGMSYPVFVKPLGFDGSEGISNDSFAATEKGLLRRLKYIHERLGADAIVEEFVDGRELYVGVLGNDELQVFPPRELFFLNLPEGSPYFASFRAKWDQEYREKWGIDSYSADPIPKEVKERIEQTARKIYRVFGLKGYARIDFRLTTEGEIVFLEANPNPSIAKGEDFALAARSAGLSYSQLVQTILELAGKANP